MRTYHRVWIRIAGHSGRIREDHPHPWRCYVDPDLAEIPIASWQLAGDATEWNCLAETDHEGDERGLIAWIRCFGDLEITDEDMAIVTLDDPHRLAD